MCLPGAESSNMSANVCGAGGIDACACVLTRKEKEGGRELRRKERARKEKEKKKNKSVCCGLFTCPALRLSLCCFRASFFLIVSQACV